MSAEFTRDHCKLAVAKILQTIGWHSINSTPLEVLTDILSKYIKEIAKYTNEYANEFGQVEPNLDHLGLAFQEMGVNLGELEEYVNFVNFIPAANSVPKYPIPKESNLNFLKPGSKEVVTRPVHINEHLPPMYPLMEEEKSELNDSGNLINKDSTETGAEFKKPPDVNSPEFKRLKREEESSRPTREISSVMMTTSGFLSPAREGRLPEAKVPIPPPEPPRVPSPPISVVAEIVPVISSKKKPDKKKEKIPKDLTGTKTAEDKPPKKINNMKDILTMKRAKAMAAANPGGLAPNFLSPSNNNNNNNSMRPFLSPNTAGASSFPGDNMKMPPMAHSSSQKSSVSNRPSSFNKTLAAAKAKTEKLNTTITPIIPVAKTTEQRFSSSSSGVDKLVNEPADRKKINILRKISNVKEKSEKNKPTQAQLIQQTQDIVSKINLSSDITIEPITPSSSSSIIKTEQNYFDDGSPPGTPPTPRTPELLTHHSPPFVANNNSNKERRKRKEKPDKPNKVKKPRKNAPQHSMSHHHHHHHPNNFLDSASDLLDISGMGRPKTPDAAHLLFGKKPFSHAMPSGPTNPLTFPFMPNFGGPGLIPSLPFRFPPPDFSGFHGISSPSIIKAEPVKKISPRPNHNKEIPIKTEPAEIVVLPPTTPGSAVSHNKSPIHLLLEEPIIKVEAENCAPSPVSDLTMKKTKEHKKDKKDKTKKKNKKEKFKDKAEKKKLKELKKEKLKLKKEKKKKLLLKAADEQQQKLQPLSSLSEFPESGTIIPKMILKVSSPSPRSETPDSLKKLNIKSIIKKELSPSSDRRETTSPGLAQISALVIGPPKPKTLSPSVAEKGVSSASEISPSTSSSIGRPPGRPRIHPIKPKPLPKAAKKLEQPFVKRDAEGNEVWICPACSQQDDGRPMIGCDGCDAWYHWVCVGIQVPPDENENWYCKPCLAKKNEDFQDKKKKRKKKDKNY